MPWCDSYIPVEHGQSWRYLSTFLKLELVGQRELMYDVRTWKYISLTAQRDERRLSGAQRNEDTL